MTDYCNILISLCAIHPSLIYNFYEISLLCNFYATFISCNFHEYLMQFSREIPLMHF